jgi:integrase
MYAARYYEPVIAADGRPRRIRRCVNLGPVAEIGSKRAAQARLAEILKPINLGMQKPKAMITFGAFVRDEWEPKVLVVFKWSTQDGYKPLLSKHILPFFDIKILSEISVGLIQGFLSEKNKSGLSWNTVRNLRKLLSSILRTAVDWNFIQENPAPKTKLPPRPLKARAIFLLPNQVIKLLAELPELYRSMVILAVLTGIRRGELFALRWGALDLEKGVLQVRESVYKGHFSTPKTQSSYRSIPLSLQALQLLRDRKAKLSGAEPENLVFASRKGTPFRPDNLLKRIIRPACERLSLPRIGWHTFRHTHATLLNDLGENLKTAQAILGHSDLETTMGIYTHAIPETVIKAEEKLSRLLTDSNGPKLKRTAKRKTEEGVWIQ